MRQPRRLWRDAGAKGFLTLNIVVRGNVLMALTFPILAVNLVLECYGGVTGWFAAGPLAPLHLTAIIAGFVSTTWSV